MRLNHLASILSDPASPKSSMGCSDQKKTARAQAGAGLVEWIGNEDLFENGLVKFVPVVEVVQIDGPGVDRTVFRNPVGAQDSFAGGIVVDVTQDRGVVLVERGLVESDTGLLLDPTFKLRIGGLVLGNKLPHRLG